MAVMFNSLVFGGIDSAEYGIYITGEAVYNAPERAVELVSVPGRNGQVAIDQGRWENVEVTYPAGCFGDSQADFAQKISAFRNAIASKIGYQRLTDTYNSDEYRMAMYTAGLEVNAENKWNGTAGEFNITFNCKPQRWLTSGETPVVVTSGDTLTNPTLYESSPLLEVGGYGHIQMGDDAVDIENIQIGNVTLINAGIYNNAGTLVPYETTAYNLLKTGDSITLQAGASTTKGVEVKVESAGNRVNSLTATVNASSEVACHVINNDRETTWGIAYRVVIDEPIVGAKGTESEKAILIDFSGTCIVSGVTKTFSGTNTIKVQMKSGGIRYYSTFTPQTDVSMRAMVNGDYLADVNGYSTDTIIGDNNTFIDCDLGEAYTIIDGEISSLNAYIDLGSDLPTLGTGETEITYDNTVTSLKISPRWWQL